MKKLQTHFGQANEDLGMILTSANKIEKRAVRIEELEFDGADAAARQRDPRAGAQGARR